MELWLTESSVHSYADDTSTSVSDESESEVVRRLQLDATNFLRFAASNSLSANPSKTGFMLIRPKRAAEGRTSVEVGGIVVEESDQHRILGIKVNNELSWGDHVFGKGSLLQSINQRVGALKRISRFIPSTYMSQIANAIVVSKVRYGAAIYGPIRMNDDEPLTAAHKELQLALNKAMRIVASCCVADRVYIAKLVDKTGIKPVNRISVESQLSLLWRAIEDSNSPLAGMARSQTLNKSSRSSSRGDLQLWSRSSVGQRNFPEKAIRLWNKTAPSLRNSKTKNSARREIREFANLLPL